MLTVLLNKRAEHDFGLTCDESLAPVRDRLVQHAGWRNTVWQRCRWAPSPLAHGVRHHEACNAIKHTIGALAGPQRERAEQT